jgi:transposase InsO family protein
VSSGGDAPERAAGAKEACTSQLPSLMESFFSTLKTERCNRRSYQTRDEARADAFDYIEKFYNLRRRPSTLDYLSPAEFDQQAGMC